MVQHGENSFLNYLIHSSCKFDLSSSMKNMWMHLKQKLIGQLTLSKNRSDCYNCNNYILDVFKSPQYHMFQVSSSKDTCISSCVNTNIYFVISYLFISILMSFLQSYNPYMVSQQSFDQNPKHYPLEPYISKPLIIISAYSKLSTINMTTSSRKYVLDKLMERL